MPVHAGLETRPWRAAAGCTRGNPDGGGRGSGLRACQPGTPPRHVAGDCRAGQAAGASAARKWILVADDDAGVRSLLVHVLTDAGYAVVEARDGAEARELTTRLGPRLVILDLRMPRVSGTEFLATSESVPVLVLSGYVGDLPAELARRPNVVGVLQKPVGLAELRAAVRRALGDPLGPAAP